MSDWYGEKHWDGAVKSSASESLIPIFVQSYVPPAEKLINALDLSGFKSQYLADYALHGNFEDAAHLPSFVSWNAQDTDEHTFQKLAEEWREDTKFTPSLTDMIMHPAYLQIIGMGPVVVPFLLRDLRERPAHWFTALSAITRQDPVDPEDAGRFRKMTEAWLEWGERRGLI